jgi:hypothetical protein
VDLDIIKMQLSSLHEYRLKVLDLKRDLKNTSWKNYKREMQKINDRLFLIDQNESRIMSKLGIEFVLMHEKAHSNNE